MLPAWLIRSQRSAAAREWEELALAGLFLLQLEGRYIAEAWHVPVFPLVAVMLFAITIGRALREMAQRGDAVGRLRPARERNYAG